jgi:thiol-disulfide isomerase/thioredoxin
MKKVLILSFFAALLIGCTQTGKTNYALLSGKITEPNSEKLNILNDSGKVQREIAVNEDGTFSDTIFNVDGYYTLSDGKESTTLYLKNGYNLTMILDTKEFDETLVYAGEGAEANNYLAQKFLANEKVTGNFQELYGLDEEQFIEKISSFYADLEGKLQKLPKSFAEGEKKNLQYGKANMLANYERSHGYAVKDNTFKVSADFPDPYENIPLNDEEEYKKNKNYRSLIQNVFFAKMSKQVQESKNKISFVKSISDGLSEMPIGNIREGIAKEISYLLSSGDADNEALYKSIMESTSDEEFKEKVTSRMEKLRVLVKGADSPVFVNYENYDGGTTSLTDLRGKFVYIDVWATWCGPCRAEIPPFKELVNKYKGKNITFVSISIDAESDKETWRKMVKEEEINWIQLFGEADWNSSFAKDYAVNSIPRFIFIDPEGKIVESDAPRPSQTEEIEKLFSESGVK